MVEISDELRLLWQACIVGNVDAKVVKAMKASLMIRDHWGASAAVRAATWGRTDSLSQLVDGGLKLNEDVDSQGNTLLHHAARHAQYDTCTFLMQQGLTADKPNLLGETPLTIAANLPANRYGKQETITTLSTPPTKPKGTKK